MQNFVQKGKIVDFPAAPSGGLVSGQAFLIGGLFGISCDTYAVGVPGEMQVEDVFDIPMAAVTPTFGQDAYWDNTNAVVTNVSTSNTKIGVFVVAGNSPYTGSAAQYGRVRLNPNAAA
jgi:predicted RecA/RadA family phage recombinase